MVAAAVIGSAVVGAAASTYASSKASGAVQDAATSSNAEQARQYNQSRQDLAPYRQVGYGALNKLAGLYGIQGVDTGAQAPAQGANSGYYPGAGGGTGWGYMGNRLSNGNGVAAPGKQVAQATNQSPTGQPDYSSFFSSPDYQFALNEGMRGVEQSAAARGGAFSGNALRGINDYAQGMASQQYGNYYNRLASLAGIGQSATNTGVQLGQNYANAYGQNAIAAGDARASGYMGAANGISNSLNSGVNNYLLYKGGYFTNPTVKG